uniref:Testis expressed 48 n=1 Tax=Spermophilus dauricus TaxID=99837 RepID=A0A8C9UQU4_SPEDA
TETHQNLASKIFCSCCRYCEDTHASDDSKVPSQTQENQPSTVGTGLGNLKKDQTGMQMTRTVTPSPPKRPSLTMLSSLLSELNVQDHQKGFYKRNLNRYSHKQWPYQSCLIGRP